MFESLIRHKLPGNSKFEFGVVWSKVAVLFLRGEVIGISAKLPRATLLYFVSGVCYTRPVMSVQAALREMSFFTESADLPENTVERHSVSPAHPSLHLEKIGEQFYFVCRSTECLGFVYKYKESWGWVSQRAHGSEGFIHAADALSDFLRVRLIDPAFSAGAVEEGGPESKGTEMTNNVVFEHETAHKPLPGRPRCTYWEPYPGVAILYKYGQYLGAVVHGVYVFSGTQEASWDKEQTSVPTAQHLRKITDLIDLNPALGLQIDRQCRPLTPTELVYSEAAGSYTTLGLAAGVHLLSYNGWVFGSILKRDKNFWVWMTSNGVSSTQNIPEGFESRVLATQYLVQMFEARMASMSKEATDIPYPKGMDALPTTIKIVKKGQIVPSICPVITNEYGPNATVLLPGTCDARCDFCFWDRTEGKIKPTEDYVTQVLKALYALPSQFETLSISGGEPTQSPVFRKFLTALARQRRIDPKFKRVVLTTHGGGLPDNIDLIGAAVDFVNISRHDPDENHNRAIFKSKVVPSNEGLGLLIGQLTAVGVEVTLNRVTERNLTMASVVQFSNWARGMGAEAASFRFKADNVQEAPVEKTLRKSSLVSLKGETKCPVCRGVVFDFKGDFEIRLKYSSQEPSIETRGVYEAVVHPDGEVYVDWGMKIKFPTEIKAQPRTQHKTRQLSTTGRAGLEDTDQYRESEISDGHVRKGVYEDVEEDGPRHNGDWFLTKVGSPRFVFVAWTSSLSRLKTTQHSSLAMTFPTRGAAVGWAEDCNTNLHLKAVKISLLETKDEGSSGCGGGGSSGCGGGARYSSGCGGRSGC